MTTTTWLMLILALGAECIVITASASRRGHRAAGTLAAAVLVIVMPAALLGATSRGLSHDLTGVATFANGDWLRLGLAFSAAWAGGLAITARRTGRGLHRLVPLLLGGLLLAAGLSQVYAWEYRDANAYISTSALPEARAAGVVDVPSEVAFEAATGTPAVVGNTRWLATYNEFAQRHDSAAPVDPLDTTRRQLAASMLGLFAAGLVFEFASRLRVGDSDSRHRPHIIAAGVFVAIVMAAVPASLGTTLPAVVQLAGASLTLFEVTKVVAIVTFAFALRAVAEGVAGARTAIALCAVSCGALILTDLGAGLTVGAIGLTMASVVLANRRLRMLTMVGLATVPLFAPLAVQAAGDQLPGAAAVRIEDWTSPWESHDDATVAHLSRLAASDVQAAIDLRSQPVPWDHAVEFLRQELAFRLAGTAAGGDRADAPPMVPADRTDELLLAEAEQAWADLGGYAFAAGEVEQRVVVGRIDDFLGHLRSIGGGDVPAIRQDGFQLQRSLYALRAGGPLGRGLGSGRPEAIPTVTEDLAIVAWGESTGLVGVIAVSGVVLLLGSFALRRADEANLLAALLVIGLGSQYAIQTIINAGGIVGALPFTGIPFPFLSRSGTAAVGTGLALGLLAAVLDRQAGPVARPRHSRAPETMGLALGVTLVIGSMAVLMATGSRLITSGPLLASLDDLEQAHLAVPDQWDTADYRTVRGGVADRHGTPFLESGEIGMPRSIPDPAAAAAASHVLRELDVTFADELLGVDRPGIVGATLVTTIDESIQVSAHRAFDEAAWLTPAAQTEGVRGAAVVLDATTGDILAMVSRPTFDLAELGDVARWASAEGVDRRAGFASRFLNRAFDGTYPPGSTFKTVTAAGALHDGLHEVGEPSFDFTSGPLAMRHPDEAFARPYQQLDIPDGPPVTGSNLDGVEDLHIDIAQAFAHSSNIAFALMGIELGPTGLMDTAHRFGFEAPVSVPGLGTSVSTIDTEPLLPADERPLAQTVDLLTRTSFGQGELAASPLQMALVSAAVANDGVIMAPRLVMGWQDPDGSWRPAPEPTVLVETGFDARTIDALQHMFRATVETGTGGRAAVTAGNEAPSVGGKTGTAEWSPAGGAHSWFIGAFPMEDPQIAIAVVVEQGGSGGGAAAEITSSILGSDAMAAYLSMPGARR